MRSAIYVAFWLAYLGGLAWLLLVFQVDTINHWEISFICKGTVVPTDGAKLMMLFNWNWASWSVLELLDWSADSECLAPLRKQETKRIDGVSPVASPMLKSILSSGRKDQLLREWIFVRTFQRWGGLVFIMGDHDNFPNWMMIRNCTFPCWMMIRYFSHWVRDFRSLSLID